MSILFVLSCVVAVSALIYAIWINKKSGSTHKETLEGIEWPEGSLPFCFILDEAIEKQIALKEAVQFGCSWWNDLTMKKLFSEFQDAKTVVPVMFDDLGEKAVMKIRFTMKDRSLKQAAFLIDKFAACVLKPDQLKWAACHEMGHLMGLAHDDDDTSVMWSKLPRKKIPNLKENQLNFIRRLT